MRYVSVIVLVLLISTLSGASGQSSDEWIYYSNATTGSTEVYRIRPDGSENQQLTFDDEEDYFQSVSPDGRWLIFQSIEGDDFFLYRLELATLEVEQLTTVRSRLESWSPDEQSFIYTVFTSAGTQLWRMDWADLSSHLVIDADHLFPYWSPDGQWIVFTLREDENLYRVNPDGANLSPITRFDGWRVIMRDWSPDGEWIVFNARDPWGEVDLYRIRPDGGGLVQITDQPGIQNYVTWLSTENWIIFSHRNRNVFRIRPDESDAQQLTSGVLDVFVGVSAQGTWLYWSSGEKLHWGHLFELDPETLNSRQLTTSEKIEVPRISPDKTQLIFHMRSDQKTLFISPVDNFEPRLLVSGETRNSLEYWQQ